MYTSSTQLPTRQPFQSFDERRKQRNRRRIGLLLFLVVIVGGAWLARPHFPGVEAKIRGALAKVFHK